MLDVRLQLGPHQFNLHGSLVDPFQKAIAENPVDVKRRPNDLLGDLFVLEGHLSLESVFHPCSIRGSL